MVSILRNRIIIRLFVIEFNVSVAAATIGVLVTRHFYANDAFICSEKFNQIIFRTLVRNSTKESLIDFLLSLFLLLFIFFAHQQCYNINILRLVKKCNQPINKALEQLESLNFKYKQKIQNIISLSSKMLKENNMMKQNNSHELPLDCQQIFKAFGCPATRVNQLVSGVKIAKVVNNVLFDGKNSVLSSQIITQNEERKGNNVINFNMILKQIKLNTKVLFPETLQSLSPFKLMDSEQQMTKFVKWLFQCWNKNQKQTEGIKNQFGGRGQQKQNFERNTPFIEKHENQHMIIRNKKTSNMKTALQPQAMLEIENDQYMDGRELSPSDQQDHQKQENLFQNVFFLDRDISPKNNDAQLNDSLEMSEKVSKKGSFKVFRPKTNFQTKKNQNQQNGGNGSSNLSPQSMDKKNQFTVTENIQRYFSEQKQQSRKTIPKMINRPPLYKKLEKNNKQETVGENQRKIHQQKIFKEPSPFQMQSMGSHSKFSQRKQKSADRMNKNETNSQDKIQVSLRQINQLEKQIKKQSQGTHAVSKGYNDNSLKNSMRKQKSGEKNQRKLFKIDIKEIEENQKKLIVQWLISINLLNSNATNFYHRFHEICKNGVIFPEIINHHIGRFKQLCYFKNPIKSAEVHSNYQKVFNYLKDVPNFESDLLFMYDFFVPQSIQSAFWSLLKSCWQCFSKANNKHGKTFSRDSYVKEKITLNSGSEKKKQRKQAFHGSLQKSQHNNLGEYEKIKFGSSEHFRKTAKKTEPKQETQNNEFSQKSQKSKRKGSLDFIKDLPESNLTLKHEELVQVEEPVQNKKLSVGYRQLHQLKKNHNTSSFVNTPQKRNDNSMSRSRLVSANSNKKSNEKIEPPSITLQMQIKSLNYIKTKGLINVATIETLSLFEDPIRNGTLFNKILCEELKINYKYNLKPKNIIDCKQNFTKGFSQIRESFIFLPQSYEIYFENIIKGELSLFYGLVWHIITSNTNKQDIILKDLRGESAILSISKNYDNYSNMENEKLQEEIIFWVRQLEQQNQQIAELHIRNMNSLLSSICSNNLLYKVANIIIPEKYNLKPTYQQPLNHLEQQSNLKKILSYYAHNKVLKSEMAWKAKSLVRKEKATTIQIMKSLMTYYKNIKKTTSHVQPENPVVSFVKFTREKSRQQNKSKERNNQRLETTMANNSFAAPLKKQAEKSVEKAKKQSQQPVEIPWMRNLGFNGDLSLNNGVIICRLISRLTMKSLNFNENPNSKAECLTNIRKALRLIEKFKWDEEDIASADQKTTIEIYKFLRQKYKHSYAMKEIF